MKIGDGGLFYHSSCKVPGVVGLCRVVKEGYPDHTAWDTKSPYFDAKSTKDNPTWYMVDVEYVSHLPHPVPLSALQNISSIPHSSLPKAVKEYLSLEHQQAIASSQLLSKGRLSVQPCTDSFYEAVLLLGENGGWEEMAKVVGKTSKKEKATKAEKPEAEEEEQAANTKAGPSRAKRGAKEKVEKAPVDDAEEEEVELAPKSKRRKKAAK
ncbi:hypothetical protein ACM66B_002113 [Microbotryomycetes sp. NB124-2]